MIDCDLERMIVRFKWTTYLAAVPESQAWSSLSWSNLFTVSKNVENIRWITEFECLLRHHQHRSANLRRLGWIRSFASCDSHVEYWVPLSSKLAYEVSNHSVGSSLHQLYNIPQCGEFHWLFISSYLLPVMQRLATKSNLVFSFKYHYLMW